MQTNRLVNHLFVCSNKLTRSLKLAKRLHKQDNISKIEMIRINTLSHTVECLASELSFHIDKLNKLNKLNR